MLINSTVTRVHYQPRFVPVHHYYSKTSLDGPLPCLLNACSRYPVQTPPCSSLFFLPRKKLQLWTPIHYDPRQGVQTVYWVHPMPQTCHVML